MNFSNNKQVYNQLFIKTHADHVEIELKLQITSTWNGFYYYIAAPTILIHHHHRFDTVFFYLNSQFDKVLLPVFR